MTIEIATDIMAMAIKMCLLIASPILATAIIIGVVVSLVQSITSIQEQTLTFVPKLVGVATVFIIAAPWMLRAITEFGVQMIGRIAEMGP